MKFLKPRLRRPRHATVVAYLALFLAEMSIKSAVPDSTYGVVTQQAAGGQLGDGDMPPNLVDPVAQWSGGTSTPDFHPATGSAVEPNGHQVTFDLYMAMNARNKPGQCIFGGTFAVK